MRRIPDKIADPGSLEQICFARLFDAIRCLLEGKSIQATRELISVNTRDLELLAGVLTVSVPPEKRSIVLDSSPWNGRDFNSSSRVLAERFEEVRQVLIRKSLDVGPLLSHIDAWDDSAGMTLRSADALMLACPPRIHRESWLAEVTAHDGMLEAPDLLKSVLASLSRGSKRPKAFVAQDVQVHPRTLVRLHGPGTPTDKNFAARLLSVVRIAAINHRALALRWSGLPLEAYQAR